MSYTSGINQRYTPQTLYNNYTAEDQSIQQTNLGLIANLKYVQQYINNIISGYLNILNPNFQGTLTGSNITLTSNISAPTITSPTNFLGAPTINNDLIDVNKIGEIIIIVDNNPPPNFILCDGSSVSIAQYYQLYQLIGVTYGGSSQSGYFNLPNFQSAFPIGGNGLIGNVASSNFVSGNSTTGATNTYSVSSSFAGSTQTDQAPLITQVPPHTHNIYDPVHNHGYFASLQNFYIYTDTPIFLPCCKSGSSGEIELFGSLTHISVLTDGTDIQAQDPVSQLSGVNLTPPYIAVNYYICYS